MESQRSDIDMVWNYVASSVVSSSALLAKSILFISLSTILHVWPFFRINHGALWEFLRRQKHTFIAQPLTKDLLFQLALPVTGPQFQDLKTANNCTSKQGQAFIFTLPSRARFRIWLECVVPSSFLAVAWKKSKVFAIGTQGKSRPTCTNATGWQQHFKSTAFRLSIQSLPKRLESTTAIVRLISVINVAGIPANSIDYQKGCALWGQRCATRKSLSKDVLPCLLLLRCPNVVW